MSNLSSEHNQLDTQLFNQLLINLSPWVFISSLLLLSLSLGYTPDEKDRLNSIIMILKDSLWVFALTATFSLIVMIRGNPSLRHCLFASFFAFSFYLFIADRSANQSDLTNFFSGSLVLLSVVIPAITACIKPKVS